MRLMKQTCVSGRAGHAKRDLRTVKHDNGHAVLRGGQMKIGSHAGNLCVADTNY